MQRLQTSRFQLGVCYYPELARYPYLIYAHPTIMTDATAELLRAYVYNGGRIIFGCRTGYKDARGHCYMLPMPGPVATLCGVTVEDFTRIGPYQQAPSIRWGEHSSQKLTADTFNDILRVESDAAEVLATYGEDAEYYAGRPVLVQHAFGKGVVYYYGAVFNVAMARAMLEHLKLAHPLAEQLTLPKEVEMAVRQNDTGAKFVFLLNYTNTAQPIQIHQAAKNLLTGDMLQGECSIAAYDVLLLQYS